MAPHLKVIREFAYPLEAELAAGRLNAEGIETVVETAGVLGTSWLNPGHEGGVILLVPDDKIEPALQLLDKLDSEFEPEYPPELEDQAKHLECPECGLNDKYYRRPNRFVEVLPIRSSFPDYDKARWICRHCNHVWTVG